MPRRLALWLAALAWLLALAMAVLVWREPWEGGGAQSLWLGPSEHVWALCSTVAVLVAAERLSPPQYMG